VWDRLEGGVPEPAASVLSSPKSSVHDESRPSGSELVEPLMQRRRRAEHGCGGRA